MPLVKDIENFTFGVVDKIEKKSIPVGSAASMLNFRTKGDKTELRRGYQILGTDLGAGGASDGVDKGFKIDGTEVPYRKRGRKLEYYDADTEDWVEVSSNVFPAAAEADEASFAPYQSQAGAILFVTSPNSSIYKIMVANPGSITDLSSTTYRGKMIIHKNRSFLWDRRDAQNQQDLTGLYLSWIDNEKYTTVSAEAVGTGDGATLVFSKTLAFKAAGAKRTCFGVVIKEDGTAKFTDDYNGNLVHVDGASVASGTINYTTGEIVLTYTAGNAPAGSVAITADHQWEDSTDEGVADFSFSATRVAGEGDLLRQDEGGPIQNVFVYNNAYFCIHERTTYKLTLSADDTDANNDIYRRNAGMPNWRAGVGTGDGVYYLDDVTENEPRVRLLTLDTGSSEVIPVPVSRQLNLEDYRFNKCWMLQQGDTILVGCRTKDSDNNNRILVHDKLYRSWDIIDLFSNDATLYNGALILGDSISENVYEALSGFDDDDALITGNWVSNQWNLDYPKHLKKVKKLVFEGEIQKTQIIDVAVSVDDGAFVTIGQIRGDGSYVDTGQSVSVGSVTIGRSEIGGGSSGATAFHYLTRISLSQDKFLKIQVRLSVGVDATTGNEGIGYFSFSLIRFFDIRLKQQKIPFRYRT